MNYSVAPDTLKGRVILVTGAGAGIGRQAAISYAQHGATVVLLGRTVEKLEHTYDDIVSQGSLQPMMMPLDMQGATKQDYVEMAAAIHEQLGRLDGVLHNASILGTLGPFEHIDEAEYDAVMHINVKAQLLMTQAVLPLLKQSPDGRLIFTSSTVGHIGRAYWNTYAFSKFATEGIMQTLADEFSDSNLRINAINPGGTRTSMRASAFPAEDPNCLKTPLEIMPLYLFLMAPESRAVHGQCIDAQPK